MCFEQWCASNTRTHTHIWLESYRQKYPDLQSDNNGKWDAVHKINMCVALTWKKKINRFCIVINKSMKIQWAAHVHLSFGLPRVPMIYDQIKITDHATEDFRYDLKFFWLHFDVNRVTVCLFQFVFSFIRWPSQWN